MKFPFGKGTGLEVILAQEDLELLKQLKAAGERGRTIRAFIANAALKRLVKGGYVVDRATALDLVNYRLTRRGEDALAEHS